MPLRELHRRVAAIALRAAARHGFALGGGNALIAYGVISRPTQDVDLVTNQEAGVAAAARLVETALRQKGFAVIRPDSSSELADLFPGLGDEVAEWYVTSPDGQGTELQLAYFERSHNPVLMDVGPVLDLEDLAGSKVCAQAGRAYGRDYVDTAALLGRWTPAELIGFARCHVRPSGPPRSRGNCRSGLVPQLPSWRRLAAHNRWRKYCAAAGTGIDIHQLRHAHAIVQFQQRRLHRGRTPPPRSCLHRDHPGVRPARRQGRRHRDPRRATQARGRTPMTTRPAVVGGHTVQTTPVIRAADIIDITTGYARYDPKAQRPANP